MKVNSFCRAVSHLEQGKGVITKKDYKRELKSSKVPEIFSKQEIDAMFAVMDEDEHLIFSTLYEAGLRKREWMHLKTPISFSMNSSPESSIVKFELNPRRTSSIRPKLGAAETLEYQKNSWIDCC